MNVLCGLLVCIQIVELLEIIRSESKSSGEYRVKKCEVREKKHRN